MKLIKVLILISIVFFFSGCLSKMAGLLPINETFNLTKEAKTALVIGSIEEGFLTQSCAAYVWISNVDKAKNDNKMLLTTKVMYEKPDFMDKNHIKFYFVFQIPEGEYRIDKWLYRYYRGRSKELNPPVIYNFENGKVYYIGHFFANAITLSLTLKDNFKDDAIAIKNKYKNFPQEKIINLSKDHKFYNWKINENK